MHKKIEETVNASEALKSDHVTRVPILVLKKSQLEAQIQHCLAQGIRINLWSQNKPAVNQGTIVWNKRPSDYEFFSKVVLEELSSIDCSKTILY